MCYKSFLLFAFELFLANGNVCFYPVFYYFVSALLVKSFFGFYLVVYGGVLV